MSVAVTWSLKSLTSYPAVRVRFLVGSGILIPILEKGICPLFVFCPVLSPAVALTLCGPHIQGGPPLCIGIVFWTTVCCSPYRHLTHGHLRFTSRGVKPDIGRGKITEKERK